MELKSAKGVRRIYNNVEYDKVENEKLIIFNEYLKKHKHELPLRYYSQFHTIDINKIIEYSWSEAMNLRFLQANAYKNDKTWNNIRDHLAWRKEKIPIQWNSNIETFLVIFNRLTNSHMNQIELWNTLYSWT